MVGDGCGEDGQIVGIDLRPALGRKHCCRCGQRLDAVPQPWWEHSGEFGQRPQRRLIDAGHALPCGGPKTDRDGDGLVILEQQWWQRGTTGDEPVAALVAEGRLDGVAQRAEPLDVAADGAPGHPEPSCEFAARPRARGLEKREQGQQPAGGIGRAIDSVSI